MSAKREDIGYRETVKMYEDHTKRLIAEEDPNQARNANRRDIILWARSESGQKID